MKLSETAKKKPKYVTRVQLRFSERGNDGNLHLVSTELQTYHNVRVEEIRRILKVAEIKGE